MNGLDKVLAGVVVSALALGGSAVALADQGGTPNQNACHGEAISILATRGFTPASIVPGRTAGEINQLIQSVCDGGSVGAALGAVQKVREAAGHPPINIETP